MLLHFTILVHKVGHKMPKSIIKYQNLAVLQPLCNTNLPTGSCVNKYFIYAKKLNQITNNNGKPIKL